MLIEEVSHLYIEMTPGIISVDAVVPVGIDVGVILLVGPDQCG